MLYEKYYNNRSEIDRIDLLKKPARRAIERGKKRKEKKRGSVEKLGRNWRGDSASLFPPLLSTDIEPRRLDSRSRGGGEMEAKLEVLGYSRSACALSPAVNTFPSIQPPSTPLLSSPRARATFFFPFLLLVLLPLQKVSLLPNCHNASTMRAWFMHQ